jgi:hypothetical protein
MAIALHLYSHGGSIIFLTRLDRVHAMLPLPLSLPLSLPLPVSLGPAKEVRAQEPDAPVLPGVVSVKPSLSRGSQSSQSKNVLSIEDIP